MSKKGESFFWTSYSDLMTSLFFVMLVLFIISLVIVRNNNIEIIDKNAELEKAKKELAEKNAKLERALLDAKATIEQQNRILKIDEQFKPLLESSYFDVLPGSKKFVAVDFLGIEIFSPNSDVILQQYKQKTIELGIELNKQLDSIATKNPDFKYMLVIEGNVANSYDHKYKIDDKYGYELSYRRALSVYQLWRKEGIDLRQYNTEILICGSGWNGMDRDPKEENNKRFSIQIVPKISSPKQ